MTKVIKTFVLFTLKETYLDTDRVSGSVAGCLRNSIKLQKRMKTTIEDRDVRVSQ